MRALRITGEERGSPGVQLRLDPVSQTSAYDPETIAERTGAAMVGSYETVRLLHLRSRPRDAAHCGCAR
jgi:hypothetical protein